MAACSDGERPLEIAGRFLEILLVNRQAAERGQRVGEAHVIGAESACAQRERAFGHIGRLGAALEHAERSDQDVRGA